MSLVNSVGNFLAVSSVISVVVPSTANKRVWWGPGEFIGYRCNSQAAAGSGVKFYDGADNTGTWIWTDTAPVADGVWRGPARPIALKRGLYIEHLGTTQVMDTEIGDL